MATQIQNTDALSDDPNHTGKIKIKETNQFHFPERFLDCPEKAIDILVVFFLTGLKRMGGFSTAFTAPG